MVRLKIEKQSGTKCHFNELQKNKPFSSSRFPSGRSSLHAPYHCYSFCIYYCNKNAPAESAHITAVSTRGVTASWEATQALHHDKKTAQRSSRLYAAHWTTEETLSDVDANEFWSQCQWPNKYGYRQTTVLLSQICQTINHGLHPPKELFLRVAASSSTIVGPHTQHFHKIIWKECSSRLHTFRQSDLVFTSVLQSLHTAGKDRLALLVASIRSERLPSPRGTMPTLVNLWNIETSVLFNTVGWRINKLAISLAWCGPKSAYWSNICQNIVKTVRNISEKSKTILQDEQSIYRNRMK